MTELPGRFLSLARGCRPRGWFRDGRSGGPKAVPIRSFIERATGRPVSRPPCPTTSAGGRLRLRNRGIQSALAQPQRRWGAEKGRMSGLHLKVSRAGSDGGSGGSFGLGGLGSTGTVGVASAGPSDARREGSVKSDGGPMGSRECPSLVGDRREPGTSGVDTCRLRAPRQLGIRGGVI